MGFMYGSCYEEHQKLADDERHPFGKKECHALIAVSMIKAVGSDRMQIQQ
jgi:hypothetical protein